MQVSLNKKNWINRRKRHKITPRVFCFFFPLSLYEAGSTAYKTKIKKSAVNWHLYTTQIKIVSIINSNKNNIAPITTFHNSCK